MRWSSRWSWPCLLLLAATGLVSAQGPGTSGVQADKSVVEPHSSADLYGSLKDVINYGAELFNKQADHAGCYRVYQGALISIRPFMATALRKRIDESIVRAESLPYYSERAFELRRTLDEVRAKAAPGKAPAKATSPAVARPTIETPKTEVQTSAPRVESPRVESPRVESPRVELPKITETPRVDPPKVEVPTVAPPVISPPKMEKPVEAPKIELPKVDPPRIELPPIKPAEPEKKVDPPKVNEKNLELPKPAELPKIDPPKVELPKIELPSIEPLSAHKPKAEAPPKTEKPNGDLPKIELPDPLPLPEVPPAKEIKDKKVEPAKAEIPQLDTLPPVTPKKQEMPAKDRGEVSGTVLLDSKPLAQGYFITLVSTDGKRFSTIVQQDGKFQFTKGLPLATYRVAVEALPGDAAKAALIPMRFRDETTSGLTVQVTAGRVTPELRLAK
jgi:hypothetical protein